MCFFRWFTPPALTSHGLSGEGINSGSHNTFLTTEGHGVPPRMRDKFNSGTTSETTRTWKTIQISHAPIHSNKLNMKGWLILLNDIRGPCGPRVSRHLSYRWGKSQNTSPRKLVQTWDRTRARCLAGAYATACSTTVNWPTLFVCIFEVLVGVNISGHWRP